MLDLTVGVDSGVGSPAGWPGLLEVAPVRAGGRPPRLDLSSDVTFCVEFAREGSLARGDAERLLMVWSGIQAALYMRAYISIAEDWR